MKSAAALLVAIVIFLATIALCAQGFVRPGCWIYALTSADGGRRDLHFAIFCGGSWGYVYDKYTFTDAVDTAWLRANTKGSALSFGDQPDPGVPLNFGFHFTYRPQAPLRNGQTARTLITYAPAYLFVLPAAGLLIWRLQKFRAYRTRRYRSENSLCLHCGYDMRASPARCPECGRAAAMRGAVS